MKKLFYLMIVCLFFVACNNNTNTTTETGNNTDKNAVSYPYLNVENAISGTSSVVMAVSLVNYDFTPLGIKGGQSQTFVLDRGMPGGYDNILISITFGVPGQAQRYYRIYKSFQNGTTTIVRIKSSNGDVVVE